MAIGVTAGAGAVWLHAAFGSAAAVSIPSTVSQSAENVSAPEPIDDSPRDAGRLTGSYASSRLEAYRRAAAATSLDRIEALIDAVLSDPPSRMRDVEIEALLARFSELDPLGAIHAARSRGLATRYRLPLFEALAVVDTAAAIDELASESPAARRREIALALLDALGGGADAFERIAAALPGEDWASFETDVLVERARVDPVGAIEALLAGNPRAMRSLAPMRIAELAVRVDPLAAIEQARRGGFSLSAVAYEAQVIEAWVRLDPDAAFDWIESLDPAEFPASSTFLASLAASDPERLLGLADALPSRLKDAARRAGTQALAGRDPIAALAMLDSLFLPPADRSLMLQTIAETYGRRNPSAALAWARGLPPDDREAFGHAVRGIAAADFDLAVDIVIAELQDPLSTFAGSVSTIAVPALILNARGRDQAMTNFAGRLLATANDRDVADVNVTAFLSLWSIANVEGAASFAVANAGRIDPYAFSTLARQMAARDPDRAIVLADQLPAEQRAGWIEGVARHLAESDPVRAKAFIDRFRGQAGYETAYRSVVVRTALTDPAAAALMLDAAPDAQTAQSVSYTVARTWARREPAAAATWALGIAYGPVRQTALRNVAAVWTATDADAARRFVAGIAPGNGRNSAIDGYLEAVAQQSGRLESSILDSYTTAAARQRGASSAIIQIASHNADEARRLLDAYITDEAIRRVTAEQIAQTGGARSGANPLEPEASPQ